MKGLGGVEAAGPAEKVKVVRCMSRDAQPTHTNELGRADATPSKQSEAKAALFSMYSHAKHRQLLIKAGQVGYLPASQLPCPSLLLSELRYPRVAANLKR